VNPLVDNPPLLCVTTLGILCLSAWIGTFVGRMSRELDEKPEHDIGVVLAATLTLLGLIIGFSVSMAISRYDQRKNYEEAEANSIGTEFVRADLLPADDAEFAEHAIASDVVSSLTDGVVNIFFSHRGYRQPPPRPETGTHRDDDVFGSLWSRYLCGVARSDRHFESPKVRETLSGAKLRRKCRWKRDTGFADA
jgi:hypothetical protein